MLHVPPQGKGCKRHLAGAAGAIIKAWSNAIYAGPDPALVDLLRLVTAIAFVAASAVPGGSLLMGVVVLAFSQTILNEMLSTDANAGVYVDGQVILSIGENAKKVAALSKSQLFDGGRVVSDSERQSVGIVSGDTTRQTLEL